MSNFSKETFWSLLSNNGGIVIPIIQRAYTQGGRGNDEAVAKKGDAFLQCLVDALIGDKPPIELDFIFGTTENGKIQPLDGQQRLTTLFLLHWYVAQRENRLSITKDMLKKFSYETRASSRYFCEDLCEFSVPSPDSRSLRDIIEDQAWFLLSWKNDPSVLSMLGMLDIIHERLKGAPSSPPLWERLTSAPSQTPITFFYTPLEAFDLTDDLYIKMNARGKELTSFEKFKAAIEKKIDNDVWDAGKPVSETFGNQMDNEWTDLFWRFRDKDNRIDRYVLRFFAAVLIGHHAGRDNAKAVRFFNVPESLTADDMDKDSYGCLYETLNLFHSAGENLKEYAINSAFFWWSDSKSLKSFGDFFKLFIAHDSEKGGMTWQQLALFHGVAVYLRYNSNTVRANLADWVRFVRNMLANETVDDIAKFVSVKNRLDEISKWSGDIYGNLAGATAASGFSHEQMKEECQKARIYQSTPDAKPFIQSIEECNFCRGRVSFIFECLGINDSVPDTDKLEKMKEVALAHLNGTDISNDFRRALLTIDDNLFYTYWQSEAHPSKCPEAFWSPQFCLIENMAELRDFSRGDKKRYLHQLLKSLLQSSLTDLLVNYQAPEAMPGWVAKMIQDKNVLDRDDARYVIVSKDKAWTRKKKTSHYPHKFFQITPD